MGFIIGLLSFFMVLDCAVLILLILIQLPKKEAGAGLAFGGAATDALFGAGSGTVLTKITKYAAGIFFVMAIILSIMQSSYSNRRLSTLKIGATPRPPAGAVMPAASDSAPATAPSAATTNTAKPIAEDTTTPVLKLTNTATIPTNPAPAPAPK
jgi:preprotein translocase subunit SecG